MIVVKELRKTFGPIIAVDNISFSVAKGDVLGLLGPNGAGKTTTMKMLSCFLAPDKGTAKIAGKDIITDSIAVRKSLGYLAEGAPSYEEMTVESLLNFVCDAREIKNKRKAIDEIAEKCSVSDVMHQPVGLLSKGYQRRVGLAQALIHDPNVLLLDEPTDGLDPNQKYEVRKLIKAMAKEKCIIISTHILEEVEAICNRIIIIDKGRILVNSTPEDLKQKEGGTLDEVFRKLTMKRSDGGAK